MPVRGGSKRNLIEVEVDSEMIGMYFRSPSPEEYDAYELKKVEVRGSGKMKNRISKSNIQFAHKLITDIRVGDFEIEETIGSGKWVPLDPAKHLDWKATMLTKFRVFLDLAGSRIFNPADNVESSTTIEADETGEDEPEKT